MNFLDSLAISASGMSAQRVRMNLISSNMAHVNTTRTQSGEPYRRKDVIFEAVGQRDFAGLLDQQMQGPGQGVAAARLVEDNTPFVEKYDPAHPHADANGFVRLPNINIVEEMVNMISASRSFEANATAVRATKDMALTALEIGKRK